MDQRRKVTEHASWAESIWIGIIAGISSTGGSFFLGLILGILEFKYVCWGLATTATVTEIWDGPNLDRGEGGGPDKVRHIRFSFLERNGQQQTAWDHVALDTPMAPGQTVDIEYIPGDDYTARLRQNRRPGTLVFFISIASLGLMGLFCVVRKAHRDVIEMQKPPHRRSRAC
jgi:hypothetical protein